MSTCQLPAIDPDRVRQMVGSPPAKPPYRRIDNLGRWVSLKLKPDDKLDIARRHGEGEKLDSIAARYGISPAYVSMIAHGLR